MSAENQNQLQITNLTLSYIISELAPVLQDGFINKVQSLDKGIYRFRIHTKQGSKDLIANPLCIYLTQYKLQAPQKSHGFADFLKKHLYNKKILSITQHNLDRVAVIEFHDFFLIFEFFSHSNIILTDKNMKILSALKREEWKDRILAKNEIYKFPASKGINPQELTLPQLTSLFKESEKDAVRTLISGFNIAPEFAEEALLNAGIEKSKEARKIPVSSLEKLKKEVNSLYKPPSKAALKPVLINSRLLLPFKLKALADQDTKSVDPLLLLQTLDDHFTTSLLEKGLGEAKQEHTKKESREEFNLNQQIKAKEKFIAAIDHNQKSAEAIYANFPALEKLTKYANSSISQKTPEKEIMYKLDKLTKDDPLLRGVSVKIDLKNRKLTVELP